MNLSGAMSWRLVVVLGLILAAYVVLSLSGVDTSGLINLVLTLAGVGTVGVHQAVRLDAQDTTLRKIDRQTNGILTARIKAAVAEALATQAEPAEGGKD